MEYLELEGTLWIIEPNCWLCTGPRKNQTIKGRAPSFGSLLLLLIKTLKYQIEEEVG